MSIKPKLLNDDNDQNVIIKPFEVIMFFKLKIKKQMLKYLKRIIHLVKNFGGYLTYHPPGPSQKFGGIHPFQIPKFMPLPPPVDCQRYLEKEALVLT